MSWGSGTSKKQDKASKKCKCNGRGRVCNVHAKSSARSMVSSHEIDHGIRWDGKRF